MLPVHWRAQEKYPFVSLRNEIDRLMENYWGNRVPPRFWENGREFLPPMDVRETADALVVEAEMPGMKAGEVNVKVEDGVLHISGERKKEKDEKTKAFHRSERFFGRIERAVTLPESADSEKVEASYKDGVLSVTVPKKAGAKPKEVTVKAK